MWLWMPQGLTDAFPATLPTTPSKKVIVKNLIEFIHPMVKYHQIIASNTNYLLCSSGTKLTLVNENIKENFVFPIEI